jgi:hypothetical protein
VSGTARPTGPGTGVTGPTGVDGATGPSGVTGPITPGAAITERLQTGNPDPSPILDGNTIPLPTIRQTD